MPKSTECPMLACFPAGRPPSSPEEVMASAGTGTGSGSRSTPSPAFLDDDHSLYPDDDAEPEADAARLSNAIASRRFFLASPGRSNSIVDSAERAASRSPRGQPSVPANKSRALRRAATAAFPATVAAPAPASSPANKPRRVPFRLRYDDMVPVCVTSAAPRADFLESMVEMADALDLDPRRGPADVACLQELLLCYIAVNEHNALSDIIGAYADFLRVFGGNATSTNADGEKTDADAQHQGE